MPKSSISSLQKLPNALQQFEQRVKTIYYAEVKKNLLGPFQQSVIKRTKSVINQMQAGYFGGNAANDPTQFKLYESEIETEIKNNIAAFAINIKTGGIASLDILSDAFIGVGKEGDKTGTAPIQWLIYFIDSDLKANLLWIDKETAANWEIKGRLGRFGEGFLMEVDEEVAKRHSDKIHPQSGKGGMGVEAFTSLITENDLMELVVNPAIAATGNYINRVLSKKL